MTSLMHMVVDNYNELISNSKDPRIDSWLLMQSPIPICSILVLYLCFVLNWGPKLMAKREPFQLKGLMIAYNAYNVIFSAWICLQPLKAKGIVGNILTFACNATMSWDMRELFAQTAWWYFFSKVIELLDTVFFVLRKKQSQVTFLHVYHHSMMAFFSWIYLKFLPGEQGIFLGLLNSFVHVIMYTYYLISALGPQYQKYLWWKKYMTTIQLTQFVLMLAYLLYIMSMDCKTPKALSFFFIGAIIIFMYLFSDFYKKTYAKQRSLKKQEKEIKEAKKLK